MKNILLEEVSSPGCHNCEAFKSFWEEEQKNWPNVTFAERSLMTPEGQELVQKHQIFASPGIILNGELYSTGGVNKEDFLGKLKTLSA
ncbi:MAG: Thioredoxin domain [Candidatus Parcubacteria bacterium]|jgi:glutaredoxin